MESTLSYKQRYTPLTYKTQQKSEHKLMPLPDHTQQKSDDTPLHVKTKQMEEKVVRQT